MTGQLGLGVMIQMLGGNEETIEVLRAALDQPIRNVELKNDADGDNSLHITLGDKVLVIKDAGQSCCEHRYMTTDDDLLYYAGSTLIDVDIAEAPSIEDKYGDPHDQQFLNIQTSKGTFTMVTHVEHNGYYGGFWLQARFEEAS
jgi:hypothetical protein